MNIGRRNSSWYQISTPNFFILTFVIPGSCSAWPILRDYRCALSKKSPTLALFDVNGEFRCLFVVCDARRRKLSLAPRPNFDNDGSFNIHVIRARKWSRDSWMYRSNFSEFGCKIINCWRFQSPKLSRILEENFQLTKIIRKIRIMPVTYRIFLYGDILTLR
jgi:hypothetical protein